MTSGSYGHMTHYNSRKYSNRKDIVCGIIIVDRQYLLCLCVESVFLTHDRRYVSGHFALVKEVRPRRIHEGLLLLRGL